MADTPDLGSGTERRAGSTPAPSTPLFYRVKVRFQGFRHLGEKTQVSISID